MAEMMQDLPALNNFSDFEQEYEIVQIQEHPLHGLFSVEVPVNYTDDEVRSYVNTLDLDLLLGSNNKQPLAGSSGEDTLNTEQLKEFENSVGAGKRGEKWFKFSSIEGGTDSIAYGHKLTSSEAESGLIKIGNDEVDYQKGLTEDQAQALLNQDVTLARKFAMASLVKVGLEGDDNKVQALTSLIYNVGSGAWSNSKAKKYLESGRVEDFMYEAFSEEVGFVKIGEDKSRGLVRRRAAEAQLFAQSNLSETNSFGNMMKDVLKKINPLSSAVAAEVTPQQQELKLGGLTPPRKPTKFEIPPRKPQAVENLGDSVVPPETPEDIPKFFRESIVPVYGDHAQAALNHIAASVLEKMGLEVPEMFKRPITEKNLDPDTLNAVRVATYNAWKNKSTTKYKDYGDAIKLIYANERKKLGSSGIAKEMFKSFFDPATAAGLTIGESSGVVVEDGHLKIKNDRYNFISIPKEKQGSDLWLWMQSQFSDQGGMFSVSPENQQKIEIDLGPVDKVEEYVKSLEGKDSNKKALPLIEATVP